MGDYEQFVASLASLGEAEVSTKLAQGVWANRHKDWAVAWLRARAAERDSSNTKSALETAQEANTIAAANLRASRSSKNAAWVAAIAAVVAAICAVVAIVYAGP